MTLEKMSWERLDIYRIKTGKTWQQVASDIGLGKSMLMMVKTGKRSLSSKAIYRLEQAEIAAGLKKATVRCATSRSENGENGDVVEAIRELIESCKKVVKLLEVK